MSERPRVGRGGGEVGEMRRTEGCCGGAFVRGGGAGERGEVRVEGRAACRGLALGEGKGEGERTWFLLLLVGKSSPQPFPCHWHLQPSSSAPSTRTRSDRQPATRALLLPPCRSTRRSAHSPAPPPPSKCPRRCSQSGSRPRRAVRGRSSRLIDATRRTDACLGRTEGRRRSAGW